MRAMQRIANKIALFVAIFKYNNSGLITLSCASSFSLFFLLENESSHQFLGHIYTIYLFFDGLNRNLFDSYIIN